MCSGSNTTKQSSTSTYTPTDAAMGVYTNVLNQAADAANTAYNPATEKGVAGFTDTQNQAFANINANQGAYQPYLTSAASMTDAAGQSISADQISQYMNPYQDQVLAATLAQLDQSNAMEQRGYMANQAAQNGLGGNGVGLGKAYLAGQQGQNRNQTIANLMSQGWSQALAAAQADRQASLSAGGQMAELANLTSALGYQDTTQLMGAGNQQQAQQQAMLDADTANAQAQTLWPYQNAQWLASIGQGIGPLTGGTTTSTGTATQSSGKGVGNVLGAGVTALGALSDERAKENIRVVGSTFDGQKVYKFNYRGSPVTQIGLMAQDVEDGEHPEAVREDAQGMKHVNYDEALPDSYADGGGIGNFNTSMPGGSYFPWAQVNASQPIMPAAMDVAAPRQEQDTDYGKYLDMGKKAAAGIGDIGRMFDSSGGWGASIVPTSSLFADGGGIFATPEELHAIEMQESGGNPNAVSSAGAQGLMQIMPDTARDPGYGVTPLRDDSDKENRRFGRDYYNAMLNKYGGDRDAARIAYNGGPGRADTWLKAGRDDSVIPRESANYYKSVAARISGTDGGGTAALAQKGFEGAAEGGERYTSKKDRTTGGILKSVFGVEFNPLNLSENERKALMVAGLSMMASGNIGKGGLAGMQYLAGTEAGERDAAASAQKLRMQMQKDAQDLALRTRAADLDERKFGQSTADTAAARALELDKFGYTKEKDAATQALELNKFGYTKEKDAATQAWDKEKQLLEMGKPTGDTKEYQTYATQDQQAGREPLSFFDYQKALKEAGRPSTNVSVSGEKKGAEEMAKLFAKRYGTIQQNAEGAEALLSNLDAMAGALNDGLNTGAFGDWEQDARRIGAAIGLGDVEKVAKGDLVRAVANKLALQVRAPGGESGGMPGAMSDADRDFLRDTVPGLLKTPGGNAKIIAIMKAAAERHRTIANMAVDFAETHDGQLTPAFDRQVREYVATRPLANAAGVSLNAPTPVRTQSVTPPAGFRILGVQ